MSEPTLNEVGHGDLTIEEGRKLLLDQFSRERQKEQQLHIAQEGIRGRVLWSVQICGLHFGLWYDPRIPHKNQTLEK